MKKFFTTLIILIILGSVGFFFGWAQLPVPPGSYGIIISKMYGVDPNPVKSGEFRWIWYKLIPTNVQIPVFRLDPVKYSVNFNSSLPSGESYASFAGINAKFSWELKADMSFNIKPDSLVSIVQNNDLTSQNDFDNYCQNTAEKIEAVVLRALSSLEEDAGRLENLLAGKQDAQMEKDIQNQFPQISGFSLIIKTAEFPDFELYKQVRLLYQEYLSKQREAVSSSFARRAEAHIETQQRFSDLERYGELITKYPVLMEYLKLEKDIKE